MAAPAQTLKLSHTFRDAKGNTAHIRVLYGDATNAALITDYSNFNSLLQAVSNAKVTEVSAGARDYTYGTNSEFPNVEDKARLTFRDPRGKLHTFEIASPKLAGFNTDGETVLASETNMAALITAFGTYIYGTDTDTAALVYVGGVRTRRKIHKRVNLFTKAPDLAGPAE